MGFILAYAVVDGDTVGHASNAFLTPAEILPEWYFFATFNLLRVLSSKLFGVVGMLSLPFMLVLAAVVCG